MRGPLVVVLAMSHAEGQPLADQSLGNVAVGRERQGGGSGWIDDSKQTSQTHTPSLVTVQQVLSGNLSSADRK